MTILKKIEKFNEQGMEKIDNFENYLNAGKIRKDNKLKIFVKSLEFPFIVLINGLGLIMIMYGIISLIAWV